MTSINPGRQAPWRRLALTCIAALLPLGAAFADDGKIKIGFMLPYTGTYAGLGNAITNGFKLYVDEQGGKLAGRAVEYAVVDDESDPAKATENANKLAKRDHVDVMVGTVHSGVAMAMAKVARDTNTLMIDPDAGADELTGPLCAPNVFRSSFSNWQPAYGMGKALAAKGVKKACWVTWDYAAGKESGEGFRDGLRSGGAELTQVLTLPFPETNFQPILAQLPGLGVDAVGSFFAGGGAVQFVKDYAAAGLREKLPLCGSGFLTEGVLKPQGAAAEGLQTALHYGDGLNNPKNTAFRAAFQQKTGRAADVYAVQGYDACQMLAIGLDATKGDTGAIKPFAAAILAAKIDSPRGAFTLSPSHNPVQTIYLREAQGGENRVIGVAAEALADPGTGCKMA